VCGKVGGPRAFSSAVTNLAAQSDLAQAQALEASLTVGRQEKDMTSALPEVLEDVSQQAVSFTQKVKNADEKALVATLVKDTVPNEMEPGQTLWVDLTFRNDGTSVLYGAQETGANLYIEILDQPNSKDYTNNFRLSRRADPMDSAAVLGNYFWQDRLGTAANPGIAVGAEGKIGFYLVAPKTVGVYTLKLGLPTSNKSTAYNKYYYEKQIFVGKTGFDTVTKDASETEFIANLIADNFPDKMTVGENKAFSATFANIGTATWLSKDIGWNFQMQQLDHTTGTDRSSNFIFSRRPDPTAAGADAGSYFYQGGSSSVAPGGQWTLNGYLHAPMTPGVYTLKFGVTTGPSAGGWYKYAFEKTIIVESGKNSEMTQVVRNASEAAYIATLIDENVPDQMEAGSAVQMAWKFRNDGTAAWGGYNNADAVKFNFVLEILDQADGTSRTNTFRLSRGQDTQKNWRNVGNWFWPNVCGQTNGQTLALDGYLLAPTTPGVYTLKIGVATSMKAERQNYKFSYEKEIVVGEASASMVTKTKDSSEAAFAAELIADSIPDAMQVGENKMVRLSLRNIGTATWKSLDYGKAVCNNQLVLVGEKNNTDRTNGFRLSRSAAYNNSVGNYFHMGGKKECAPGRIWNYDLWLHAPTTEGYYTLKIGLDTRETDGGWYTYYFEKTIKVGNPTTQPEESTETEIKDPSLVPVGTNAYDGVIVSADMLENMLPGELTPVSITVKNTGTNTWYGFIGGSSRAMRLSAENAQGFGFYTDADGTKTGTSGAGHIDIPTGVAVVSGDTYTFTAYLKAPAARGIYALKMVPYSGAGGWHTAGGHTFNIRVSKTGGTYTPTEPTYTSDRRDAEVIVSSIPTAVETGTQSQIAVWMKNNGQETWTPGTDIDGYFLRYKVAGHTAGYAPVAETIEPGEKTHLTLRYDAPNREDNYSVQVQMVYLSKGSYKPFGDKVSLRADTDNSLGVKNAQILSVTAPEEMPEGTKGEIAVEVLNIGTMTWDSKVVLAEQNAKAYMSRTGAADDMQALASAVGIEPGVEVATGERYIFRFDLHTWTNSNTYAVYEAPGTTISQNLRMAVLAGEHAGTFGDEFEIKSLVTQIPVESDLIVYADADDVEMSGQTRSYEIISASVPTQMNGSQIAPITFTVKNTGNTAWVKHDGQFALHKMRLAMDSENYEFGLYTDLNGVTYHSGNRDRIDIVSGETVMPGEVYTFSAFLKAPAYTGYYKIELRLTADGVGPEFSQQTKGDSKVYGIRVDGTTLKGEDIYTNEGI
ncbi:MAG: hypothetical protein IIY04_01900, partial [Oscillospiraceae bacterium]|nr:hypothetical protein [Oscillospiraceae bacterium]